MQFTQKSRLEKLINVTFLSVILEQSITDLLVLKIYIWQ